MPSGLSPWTRRSLRPTRSTGFLLWSKKEILTHAEADDLRDAFNVIMLVRVRHHANVLSQGGDS